jgi:DNA-binding protein HU-beta
MRLNGALQQGAIMANNMTKAELIEVVAGAADISKAAANEAINSFLGAIAGHVGKGGKVTLVGFGSFFLRKRAARTGRNPQTGEKIKIAASASMAFKGSKAAGAKKAAPKKAGKKK